MCRKMTSEEQLEYISETLEAIKKDGLLGAKILVQKWEEKLSNSPTLNESVEKTIDQETLRLHEKEMFEADNKVNMRYPHVEQFSTAPMNENTMAKASIYAAEHLPKVQEDLGQQTQVLQSSMELPAEEQHKLRILELEKNIAPNIWGDAKVVVPGEFGEH